MNPSPKLKALSDLDREMLDALGIAPSNFQESVQKIMNKTYTKEMKEDVHKLNRKVEEALTVSEPTSEIVQRLEAKEEPEQVFVPNAYVIFIRKWSCICGASGSCLDYPGLFLREVPLRRPREHTVRYRPVREIAYPKLPKLREVVVRTQFLCDDCFDDLGSLPISANISIQTLSLIAGGLLNGQAA